MPMAHGCAANMIPILILAAGSSSRMRGRDKLLEEIGGMPLLRRTAQRAKATGSTVYAALPARPHLRYDALGGLDVTCIPVADASEGMNASLRKGLAAMPADTEAVMVILADMPDLTTDDLMMVLNAVDLQSEARIWRATTQDGSAGHPIVFHRSLLPKLTALVGDSGGQAVVKQNAHHTVYIALPDQHARTDLDTPEAWAEWKLQNALIN